MSDLLAFRDDYVDILGTHHLSWVQVVGNEPIFGAGLKAAVKADGSLDRRCRARSTTWFVTRP